MRPRVRPARARDAVVEAPGAVVPRETRRRTGGPRCSTRTREWLSQYFASAASRPRPVPLDLLGTDFERAVWREIQAIPPGSTTSYGAIAASLGRTDAARAVGAAVGANPVSLIVPCHRVVGTAGVADRLRRRARPQGVAAPPRGRERRGGRPVRRAVRRRSALMNAVDIGPIAPDDRGSPAFDLFLIFACANIVATTFQTGASLVPAFGLRVGARADRRRQPRRVGAHRGAGGGRPAARRALGDRGARRARPAGRGPRGGAALRHQLRLDRRQQRDRRLGVRAHRRRARLGPRLGGRARRALHGSSSPAARAWWRGPTGWPCRCSRSSAWC